MSYYDIRLTNRHGNEFSRAFGEGNSAMEAAENAVKDGSLYLPAGEVVEAVAINTEAGIAFKFEMAKRF